MRRRRSACGLINRVLPDAELEAYVRSYCAMISENAPLTLAAIRAAAFEVGRPDGEIDAKHLDALVARCFDSDDYKEGRNAFLEKRKPAFRGRSRPLISRLRLAGHPRDPPPR